MAELKQRGYHSALVPILGTSVDNEAMARAAKLVGPDGAVEAVYVLKVPEQLPLDGGLEQEEQEAWRVLEVARLQAKVAGCRARCRLIRTRSPGRAIVEEAGEGRSDLIYISTEHAQRGGAARPDNQIRARPPALPVSRRARSDPPLGLDRTETA